MEDHSDSIFQGAKGSKDSELVEAVRQTLWDTVRELLEGDVDHTTRRWAVQKAISDASDEQLLRILPHCTDDQVETVLTEAVSRCMWEAVAELVARGSDNATRTRTVQECVLPHCSQDQLDSVLMEAVGKGLWDCAETLLHLRRDAGDDARVGEHTSDEELLGLINTFPGGNQSTSDINTQVRDRLFLEALQRHLWEGLVTLLQFLDRQEQKFIWLEASRFAPVSVLENISPKTQLTLDDETDQVLRNLVKRDLWGVIRKLISVLKSQRVGSFSKEHLTQSQSNATRALVVQEASRRAAGEDLECILGSWCTDDMLDIVVPELLDRQEWKAFFKIIHLLSPAQAELVLNQADKHADKETLEQLFDKCSYTQLNDTTVKLALKHGFWRIPSWYLRISVISFGSSLGTVRPSVSEELRRLIVDEAVSRAGDGEFASIALQCLDDQLQRVLTEAVSRRLWDVSERLMKRETDAEKLGGIVVEASKHADEVYVLRMIQNNCSVKVADSVLTQAVERGMWSVVTELLKQEPGPSEAQCEWAIREAARNAKDPHLCTIVSLCSDDQVEDLMKEVVGRQAWNCVADLFTRELTDDMRKWALEKAVKHLSEYQISRIIPYFVDSQLDSVLTELVNRDLWECVFELFEQKSQYTLQSWAVTEASKRAPGFTFRKLIPYCDSDQLDCILKEVVRRKLWTCVYELFQKNISSSSQELAIAAASEDAPEMHLTSLVQCVIDDELRDIALEGAMKRGLWRCVRAALELQPDPCFWDATLLEASKHATESGLFQLLEFVTGDCRHAVLTITVQRKLWKCVSELLEYGATDEDCKLALEEASREAPEFLFLQMLRHCPDDAVESVFVQLIKRRLWQATSCLLRRPLDCQEKVALKKTVEQTEMDFDAEVGSAVKQDAWAAVSLLLECAAVSHATRRQAAERLLTSNVRQCGDRDFISMLQHLDQTQLLLAFQAAVKRNLPETAIDILTRIGQEGDLLAVTDDNRSILKISMEIQTGRRQLVAECLKLGVGTHQPQELPSNELPPLSFDVVGQKWSSLMRAALENDPVLVRLLLETGVCRNSEVHKLNDDFSRWSPASEQFETTFQNVSSLLRDASSTPRSLKSACRLVISHHLGVGYGRPERVKQLPLPERLKDYMSFPDLEMDKLHDDNDKTRSSIIRCAINDVRKRLFRPPSSPFSNITFKLEFNF